MTLLQLRQMFLKYSGRADLVTPGTYADNGANDLIWFGQKYLEGLVDLSQSELRYQIDVAAGEFAINIPLTRIVRKVTLANADGTVPLVKKSLDWLNNNYGDRFENITNAAPAYYAVGYNDLHENQAALTSSTFTTEFTYDEETVKFTDIGDRHLDSLLIILPPPDGVYTISVHGKFTLNRMTVDADENAWSIAHPNLLLFAALRELEVRMRNSEGLRDRDAAINALVFGIDKDMADQDSVDVRRFER